jgi:hypothetical protein
MPTNGNMINPPIMPEKEKVLGIDRYAFPKNSLDVFMKA